MSIPFSFVLMQQNVLNIFSLIIATLLLYSCKGVLGVVLCYSCVILSQVKVVKMAHLSHSHLLMFCFSFNNTLLQNQFGGTANVQAFSTGKHHSQEQIPRTHNNVLATTKINLENSYALATNHIPLALYRELFSRVCKRHLIPFVRLLLYELIDSACSALLRTSESCSSILHYSLFIH